MLCNQEPPHRVWQAVKLAALLILAAGIAFPASRVERYVLILKDKPAIEQAASRKEMGRAAAIDARQAIVAAQKNLASALAERGVRVRSANQLLANVMFVEATAEQAEALRQLPGVAGVQREARLKLHLNKALDIINATAAWSQVNGPQNAGAGVKIGVLDTGIDITHPGFRDDMMQYPEGFPKCLADRGDCAYANRKVIVARSYVRLLVGDKPEFSRPDDLSPRDRVGHGTAVAMIAAGVQNTGPAATIQGVAPGAWLGNYKVFGSPGVNGQYTTDSALLQAIEDAFTDGMDIITMSLGAPAEWGPRDSGSVCGFDPGEACDWRADAIERAAQRGMVTVVSAGNDASYALNYPGFNTISTPGTAPSAITVGASTNGHIWYQKARTQGDSVPSNLRDINVRFGDGPVAQAPITAPIKDVSKLGDNGQACSPLGNGALDGAVALVDRGGCQWVLKINNAQRAGAVAVIVVQSQGSEGVYSVQGLGETSIPMVLMGNRNGVALRNYIAEHPNATVTLDPGLVAVDTREVDVLAEFSSRGPSLGENGVKPEIVAVGTDMYTATQTYDPNGDMYDKSGYTAADGTSFAAPMAAGVAAMVKQKNPRMTVTQVKSAVVNTAIADVYDYDNNGNPVQADILDVGAGRLNANAAVRTNVTAEPATLSWGVWGSTAAATKTLTVYNHSGSNLQVRLSVLRASGTTTVPALDQSSFTVAPNQGGRVSVRLTGSRPSPGAYTGIIQVDGGTVPLRIPYAFFVADNTPDNIISIRGDGFTASAGTEVQLMFKVVDKLGLPIEGLPVAFRPTIGNGRVVEQSEKTDSLGIGYAWAELGDQLGEQEFTVAVGDMQFPFWGRARMRPTIASGGVVNAASGTGGGVAPGSYITIWGRGLAEITKGYNTAYLPLSIANVSVSFDVPSQGISAPGRLTFVSDGQINVQVPWELQGASSAIVKVSIGDSSSSLVTVPIATASPALFEYTDASGRVFAAALDEAYRLVGSSNPVAKGRVLQLYANGLGPVDNQPASGEAASGNPLAGTRTAPTVTIGGRPAQVLFSGLAPGFVGLYQVNVTVPGDAPSGPQPVVISISGAQSKAVNVPVQ